MKTPLRPNRRRRQREQWTIVAVVLVVLAAALMIAARDVFRDDAPTLTTTTDRDSTDGDSVDAIAVPKAVTDSADPVPQREDAAAAQSQLIDDDGRTMWVSPTAGPPVDLAYLPLGCQLFIAMRPADLCKHTEGDKVLAALGRSGQRGVAWVEQVTGLPIEDVKQVIVGLKAQSNGDWDTTLVVRPTEPQMVRKVLAQLDGSTEQTHANQSFRVAGGRAYWNVSSNDEPLLVITSRQNMPDIIDLRGAAPPLRRDMERLVAASHAGRHFTLFFAPNYLASDGRAVYSGVAQRLRDPVDWFLGEGLTAVAVSLHWADDFFAEVRAAATIDTPAEQLAARLAKHVQQLPAGVEDFVFQLEVQPYGRRLLARFPGMLRALARYTRFGFEDDHALLRAYLPVAAGHNLLMAGELALVEPVRGDQNATAAASPQVAQTVRERLATTTTLSFPRDTLEAALQMLGDDIGVRFVLAGADLQLEGITKNQSFGLDARNLPAEEILLNILRRANPDKSADGFHDPRQKLVYVVKTHKPGQPETIVITTRTAAQRRGDDLPEVFRTR